MVSNAYDGNFICGEDLRIPHPAETTEDFFYGDGHDVEFNKNIEKNNLRIMKHGFKVIKELSNIKLDSLINPSHDWLIFNRYNSVESEELKNSIANNGLFTPIIVWEWCNDKYMILSGVERVSVYRELYEEVDEDKKELYSSIPGFILKCDEINDVIARIIRIDSNICVRHMDVRCKNRAICERYMALKKLKSFRNEYNILDELSKNFSMSRTSIANHLLTQKVIEEFLYLFQEGVLSLKSIKKLSNFSLPDQRKILDGVGFNNIKDCQISALNLKSAESQDSLKSSIKIISEIKEPYFVTLRLRLPRKFKDEAIVIIKSLLKKNPYLQMKLKKT